MIKLAQGHSANKDTQVRWAPDTRTVCQYFLCNVNTVLGTLSLSLSFQPFSPAKFLLVF